MAGTIYVLNGPNLNRLGTREPQVYGQATLKEVERICRETSERLGFALEFRQSNHEGELIDWIHEAGNNSAAGIVFNPAGYTHTSVSIRDAIAAINIPLVEVHITNIFARESFRHVSHVAPVAKATLCGFGPQGYALAIEGLVALLGVVRKA